MENVLLKRRHHLGMDFQAKKDKENLHCINYKLIGIIDLVNKNKLFIHIISFFSFSYMQFINLLIYSLYQLQINSNYRLSE